MPHSGWLDMSKPYIAAFKAGAKDVTPYITQDELIYWYRPTLRSLDCDATDTTMVPANNGSGNYFEGRPNGWQSMSDSVFVVSMLTSPGTIAVTSGSNTVQTFNAPAGASVWSVPMGIGSQKFDLQRNGASVMSVTSLKDISNVCPCGIYNFNAYVGTLTCSGGGEADPLGPDGLASLTAGLHVTTCQAKPSLGTPLPGSCTAGSGSGGTTLTTSKVPGGPTTTAPSSTPPMTSPPTSVPTTTLVTSTTGTGKACGRTITASSQIFPTNCLMPGDVWAGPAGDTPPDHCDGAKPCGS